MLKKQMSRNPGRIVKYMDKEGNEQKAFAYNRDQNPTFIKGKQVLLHLIDDNYNFKTAKGQRITVLKQASELTVIGFID